MNQTMQMILNAIISQPGMLEAMRRKKVAEQEAMAGTNYTIAQQPQQVPQQQYIKPKRVKQFSDGAVKRWDDYNQTWVPMSPQEVNAFISAGGSI